MFTTSSMLSAILSNIKTRLNEKGTRRGRRRTMRKRPPRFPLAAEILETRSLLSGISLTPINAQTISHNDTLTVALSATDGDGDSLTYTATVDVDSKGLQAYNLDQAGQGNAAVVESLQQ